MLNFQKISHQQRTEFEQYLLPLGKSCEYAFTNLCIWGRQRATVINDYLVLFSHFDRRAVYPFPAGKGELKPVMDAIIEDAHERGIACCITGLSQENMDQLERLYPGKFTFQCDRDSFDYVYNIDDLADLKGRKYQKKRNHINKFRSLYPDWRTEVMTAVDIPAVREMCKQWFESRQKMDPTGSYTLEQVALERAFEHFVELGLEGMLLMVDEQIVAFSIASRLSTDTFDVHFEKALEDIDGAYTTINQAFAQHLRDKYPELRYLDREEDMGLEGLRKAKLSYYPDHFREKCWARLWEEIDEN
jgi:hypothetical protein